MFGNILCFNLILETKDQVFEKFVEWRNMVETQFGLKRSTQRRRRRVGLQQLLKILKNEGIAHQRTKPKKKADEPHINGICTIHVIWKKKFLVKTPSTAVYLRDQSLASTLYV